MLLTQARHLLHPQHVLYVRAAKLAFEDCFNSRQFGPAVEYGSVAVESYRHYRDRNPSAFVQLLVKLAKSVIAVEGGPSSVAETHLREAARMTSWMYGEDSLLAEEVRRLLRGGQPPSGGGEEDPVGRTAS